VACGVLIARKKNIQFWIKRFFRVSWFVFKSTTTLQKRPLPEFLSLSTPRTSTTAKRKKKKKKKKKRKKYLSLFIVCCCFVYSQPTKTPPHSCFY
jgi:hypothetical protein